MHIGILIRIITLPVIIILFVSAHKSELNKKYNILCLICTDCIGLPWLVFKCVAKNF
jgi:hypothetical protein